MDICFDIYSAGKVQNFEFTHLEDRFFECSIGFRQRVFNTALKVNCLIN